MGPPSGDHVRVGIARPPLTWSTSPVTKQSSLASQRAASATSLAVPRRRSGILAAMRVLVGGSARTPAAMGVPSVGPGATLFTRLPRHPNSAATARPNTSPAALLTIDAAWSGRRQEAAVGEERL